MTLVVMPVASGLHATPSFAAEAVQAKGGCWAHVPELPDQEAEPKPTLLEVVTAKPKVDGHSTTPGVAGVAALDWSPSPDGAQLLLESRGGTARESQRTLSLTLTDGPVLDAVGDHAGEAYAVLRYVPPSAKPEDDAAKIAERRVLASAPFEVKAGEQVDELTLVGDGVLDLEEQGDYTVILESVVFTSQAPDGTALYWTCNGQTGTEATATRSTGTDGVIVGALNPADTPVEMADVTDQFQVQDISLLVLHDVRGQVSTGAARPGDRLVLSASGMDSVAEFQVGFGPAGADFVTADVTVLSDENGDVAEFEVIVPEGAPVGPGEVTLVTVATPEKPSVRAGVPLAMQVLGEPTLSAEETVGDEQLELVVAGVGFDPLTEVRVRARAGDDAAKDKVVTVWSDGTGAFSTDYVVADEDATAVRALQRREGNRAELAARHELVNSVPPPAVEPPPTKPPVPTSGPIPTSQPVPTTPPVPAPTQPPLNIPLPPEVDIDEIPAPEVPDVVAAAELTISEPVLEGSPSMGELFGGASQRRVVFEVENVGEGVAIDPQVQLGVGRSTDVVPSEAATTLGDMQPGARVAVGINLELPMASFGTYQVVGQVVDQGAAETPTAFSVRWDTYPYGLFAVNAAGLGLLVWGVSRRRQKAAPLPAGPDVNEAGASVVDLAALDKWWKEGKVVHTAPEPLEDNDSVVDLEAADRWWARNQGNVS